MYAVERLGSYITRGVYTVSGPFHPFGGAVDIIVVQQPDGSFKSSPWYVRFGKFQGVLKAREKVVTINVNGTEANFHMYLDQRGEAHFLREREGGEGESLSYVSYSSDEMDDQSQDSRMIIKSRSYSYDGSESSSVIKLEDSNGKIDIATDSRKPRIPRFVIGQRSLKEDGYLKGDDNVIDVKMSSLDCTEIEADLVETFMLDESDLGGELVQTSEISNNNYESRLKNSGEDKNSEDITTVVSCSNSPIAHEAVACPEKKFDVEQVSDKGGQDALLSGIGIPKENGLSRIQSSNYCEISSSLTMGLDGLPNQSADILYLAKGGSGDSHICVETLHTTAKPLIEVTGNIEAEDLRLEGKQCGCSDTYPQQTNPSSPSIHGHDRANLKPPVRVTTSCTQIVCINAITGPNVIKYKGAGSVSCFSNSVYQVQNENGDKFTRNNLPFLLGSVDDSVKLGGDCGPRKTTRIPVSESSEEDQFFFSDIDDFESGENQAESTFPDVVDKDSFVQMNGSHSDDFASGENQGVSTFPDALDKGSFLQMNGSHVFESLPEHSKVISSPVSIPRRHSAPGADVARLAESLPNMWSDIDNLGTENLHQPLSHSLELKSTFLELNCTTLGSGNGNQSPHGNFNEKDIQAPEGSKDGVDNPTVGDLSKAIDASSGSWRLWPFPFRRSRSRKNMQPTLTVTQSSGAGNTSASNGSQNNKNDVKDMKKMLKATTPTSEELASLNLNEGSNAVTFTFSTAMLGRQKVDARIYLWKWNTRIVISDVDGTITKSDVLGQFMPLVGIDWSQTGVVHLFSAIKDNGYQFLYLSARSISQAYITRQFLVNLKQDGKVLPDGPVVISPDGLFPSLFREVIRRAPHEFKIACLEDIKALFPPDSSTFYAGFGNRDTDEISYLKVGIPKGKIFIINPKGEVAVNRLVDTRSYTSLHALVHGMFPATTSSEQEDYNSWNFWKLPPPHIDIDI